MCNSGDKGAPWSLLLEFRIKLGSGGGLADKTGHSPPPAGGAYATFLRFMYILGAPARGREAVRRFTGLHFERLN